MFGSTSCNQVSRFVKEIPEELLDGVEDVFGSRNRDSFEEMVSRRGKVFGSKFFGDSGFSWSYGNSGRGASSNSNSGSSWGSGSSSTKLGAVASSIGKSATNGIASFGRTAESFLNGLANKSAKRQVDLSEYNTGVKVFHKKFGEGVITGTEPEGDDLKVDIDFEKFGHKRLMAKFSNLEII